MRSKIALTTLLSATAILVHANGESDNQAHRHYDTSDTYESYAHIVANPEGIVTPCATSLYEQVDTHAYSQSGNDADKIIWKTMDVKDPETGRTKPMAVLRFKGKFAEDHLPKDATLSIYWITPQGIGERVPILNPKGHLFFHAIHYSGESDSSKNGWKNMDCDDDSLIIPKDPAYWYFYGEAPHKYVKGPNNVNFPLIPSGSQAVNLTLEMRLNDGDHTRHGPNQRLNTPLLCIRAQNAFTALAN